MSKTPETILAGIIVAIVVALIAWNIEQELDMRDLQRQIIGVGVLSR